ncbi:hypothetical protein D3C76_904000 [compost metagenome]
MFPVTFPVAYTFVNVLAAALLLYPIKPPTVSAVLITFPIALLLLTLALILYPIKPPILAAPFSITFDPIPDIVPP